MTNIFTPEFLKLVVYVGGIITAITEALKRPLHLKGVGAVVLSVVVGAIVCAVQVVATGWDTLYYFYLALSSILFANGAFKLVEEHAEKSGL